MQLRFGWLGGYGGGDAVEREIDAVDVFTLDRVMSVFVLDKYLKFEIAGHEISDHEWHVWPPGAIDVFGVLWEHIPSRTRRYFEVR